MCGVIGIWQKTADVEQINRVFRETMIRGKHATGVTYLKSGKLKTEKEGVSAEQFLSCFDFNQVINSDNSVLLIGHIRYSTSDLRYNQPFEDGIVSIAHNGVISQEGKETWKYPCETANDSELILRSIQSDKHPLSDFAESSQAVVGVGCNGDLFAWRNQSRPLWVSREDNYTIFTSTRDIAVRSGLTNTEKCDMLVEYRLSSSTRVLEKKVIVDDSTIEDLQ